MGDHRHKRVTRSRTVSRVVAVSGSLAVAATLGVVSAGVLTGRSVSASLTADSRPAAASGPSSSPPTRTPEASRDLSRGIGMSGLTPREDAAATAALRSARIATRKHDALVHEQKATARAVAGAHTDQWATTDLDVWTAPQDGRQQGEIQDGDKVLVTGRVEDGRTEVVVRRQSRWVTSGYLSADKPLAAASGLSMAPCPDMGVEYRLTSGAVYVYRSVCHAFPQVTTYGGWDNHGEHASGKAIDIMTSDVALGTAIANFLQAHASELDLYDIIWRQHIWTPVRASEGWRSMASRGSETANHYDHVHVSVN